MDLAVDMDSMDFFEELYESPLGAQEENVVEDDHDVEAKIQADGGKNLLAAV